MINDSAFTPNLDEAPNGAPSFQKVQLNKYGSHLFTWKILGRKGVQMICD